LEDELVKTITSNADLSGSHQTILELAAKMNDIQSKRKSSLLNQVRK
jgi:hypothetical protein